MKVETEVIKKFVVKITKDGVRGYKNFIVGTPFADITIKYPRIRIADNNMTIEEDYRNEVMISIGCQKDLGVKMELAIRQLNKEVDTSTCLISKGFKERVVERHINADEWEESPTYLISPDGMSFEKSKFRIGEVKEIPYVLDRNSRNHYSYGGFTIGTTKEAVIDKLTDMLEIRNKIEAIKNDILTRLKAGEDAEAILATRW